jgi:hypothetical protein
VLNLKMVPVNILVEGITDEPVAKRLLNHVGLQVGTVYGRKGKAYLLERLPKYNKAARFSPWFVVVDLDGDTQCASQAVERWLPNPEKGMHLRVAVQAIESWIMADVESLASFLVVSSSKLKRHTEFDPNPKEALLDVARTSRNKSIREDIVPRQGSGAKVGPLYVARITEFAERYWRPDIAAENSESLRRCIRTLSTLASWDA